ncbi:MAG: preprotein translocase subunit SecE [Bdellovibrionales bacterium]|nr:preprotein translocase subunit SecE [Bdellovibrionales bacterium]
MAASREDSKLGPIGQGREFISDSIVELKKVSVPTRQETVQATMVVIFMLFVVSIYLGMLDLIFKRLMESILS